MIAKKTGTNNLEFSLCYGELENIGDDVELFERFYRTTFHDEACERLATQVRKRCVIYMIIALAMASSCLFPLVLNIESIFVYLLCVIGLVPLGITLFYLFRFITARQYCAKNLNKLLDGQFASSRSEANRVFTLSFFTTHVEISFGTTDKVIKVRKKAYDDIEAVYETDGLYFIKGITWLSKFQMDDDSMSKVEQIFREKMQDRYICA